jgi:DNA-binding MarR family transcriptional regulator
MVTQWLKKQTTPAEALFHNGLRTVVRQDAFRILHNFAKMAENQSNEEFFVSQKQLAERLNITKPGAALILAEFIKGEAIQLTNKETANRARRYVWLLG